MTLNIIIWLLKKKLTVEPKTPTTWSFFENVVIPAINKLHVSSKTRILNFILTTSDDSAKIIIFKVVPAHGLAFSNEREVALFPHRPLLTLQFEVCEKPSR